MHALAALAGVGHTFVHVPQWFVSVAVSRHSIDVPVPQITRGAGQSMRHAPLTHIWPIGHALPHMPQFAVLVFGSMHAPLQSSCPIGHSHVPATQLCPVAHAISQAPQWVASVSRFTHAVPQRVSPAAHVGASAPVFVSFATAASARVFVSFATGASAVDGASIEFASSSTLASGVTSDAGHAEVRAIKIANVAMRCFVVGMKRASSAKTERPSAALSITIA